MMMSFQMRVCSEEVDDRCVCVIGSVICKVLCDIIQSYGKCVY